MKKWFLFFFAAPIMQISFGQTSQEFEYYIAKYKNIAISEMVRCGIPASITLAQGLHESNCGKSPLSREANNHFGIKCKADWDGKKYYQNDDSPNECFRVYEHAGDSYADHSDFLVTRDRYAGLFKLQITDYKAWAKGLKQCGYATNPRYAEILIKHIEEYHLDELDKQGLALIAEKEKLMAYTGNGKQVTPPVTTTSTRPAPATPVAPVVVSSSPAAAKKPVIEEKPVVALRETTAPKEAEAKRSFLETPNREPDRKKYMVNGSLALVAAAGEDPLKIAFDYNIDYSHILQFNDLDPGEHFKEGEFIFLQSKKNKGPGDKYVVQYGEGMRDVSQKVGIKLRELYTKNLMKPNEQVYAGEILYLQEKRNSAPHTMSYAEFLNTKNSSSVAPTAKPQKEATASNNITYNPRQYQVQPTDTLYSIAKKFNLSVEELKNLNNLQTSDVQTGQKLVVSK